MNNTSTIELTPDIRERINILALDTLIKVYTESLENIPDIDEEQKELARDIIRASQVMLEELYQKQMGQIENKKESLWEGL